MRFVKTQKILYNNELRIRFIADNEDAEYIRLIRNLPDCRWSSAMNTWHTHYIQDYIPYLNKVFPKYIRFYDVSKTPAIPEIEEENPEKRVKIKVDNKINILQLEFLYDRYLAEIIKSMEGTEERGKKNCWIVSNSQDISSKLIYHLKKYNYKIDFEKDSEKVEIQEKTGPLALQEEEKLREGLKNLNYNKRTIEQYVTHARHFMAFYDRSSIKSLKAINSYVEEITISRNYSRSYQNLVINSIKAYYRFVKGIRLDKSELPRPRRYKNFPVMLSEKEIAKIIEVVDNEKHHVLFGFIYETGITVSEVVRIKPTDIDFTSNSVVIEGKKSVGSRILPISSEMLDKIGNYFKCYHPRNFLFEGYGHAMCSERAIQKAFQKYVMKAGIEKKVSVHSLRHSCAMKLAGEGAGTEELQKFLGHSSQRTTEMYRKALNFWGAGN